MNRYSPWRSYQQVSMQTAQPAQLVLMMYDGSIRFLELARKGFHLEDPQEYNETINNNVQRAQAIITELNASLNMTAGGDFAANLRRLYEYFDWRLMESNIRKEEKGILEVIQRLSVLRDAWAQMMRQQGQGASEAIPEFGSVALAAVG